MDQPSTLEPTDFEMAASFYPGCPLLQDILNEALAYWPDQQAPAQLLHDLGLACESGDQGATTAAAWALVEAVESAIDDGIAGAPAIGSSLVNKLLACTLSLCVPAQSPGLDFSGALSGTGLFGVRRTGTEYAASHAAIPFTDWEGTANGAYWGVEVDQSWSVVVGQNPVLVYGEPIIGALALNEVGLSDIQFELNLFPDNSKSFGDDLHVGICLTGELPIPHVIPGDHSTPDRLPTLRREGVILQTSAPGFCGDVIPQVQIASLLGGFAGSVERWMPTRLRSVFFSDRKTTVIGGTPLDFSRFAAVGVNTFGSLVLLQGPNANVVEGQSIGNLIVQAITGDGTPIEKVAITWGVFNNRGEPAGAILSGVTTGTTIEFDGVMYGTASFNDIRVGKPGGYIVCATGTLAEYEFERVCSERFHAKNAK